MTPETFLTEIIDPGLLFLQSFGGLMPTDDARRFLLAVALQESGPALDARYQGSPSDVAGAARGWWQFEQGNATSCAGVYGVLYHELSADIALEVCAALSVVSFPAAVWRAIEGNDLLAVSFARLLMLTDPYPIPTIESDAWVCYCDRLWRPGKPHPETWPANWQVACDTVKPRWITVTA